MRIAIEPDTCIGAGQCVLAAPALFDQRDDDGLVIVLDDAPAGPEADAARSAAKRCPVRAIRLEG